MHAVQPRNLDNHMDWKLLKCWAHRAAISSLKSIWRPITSDQPQGLILFNIFTNVLSNGTESPLRKSAYNKELEEWLIQQMGLLPLRGTLIGWRNEMTKHLESAPNGNVKSSTWGRIQPCLWSHRELTIWRTTWKEQPATILFVQRPTASGTPLRRALLAV